MRHRGGYYVVKRQGFLDLAYGVKRVSVTLVRKEMKKGNEKTYPYMCAHKCRQ